MAARALTAAAGRRMAGQTGPPLLASCRRGGTMNHSTSAQPEEEHRGVDGRAAAAMTTGAQVEAALNRKNVEVLQGEEHTATVLPDHETLGAGALEGAGEDASWVPDQETGVFGPADADSATHGGAPPAQPHPPGATAATGGTLSSSVLDQTVFVREEDMEDVERPAIDMANANANSKN